MRITPVYQPVVRIDNHAVLHYEVLARVPHDATAHRELLAHCEAAGTIYLIDQRAADDVGATLIAEWVDARKIPPLRDAGILYGQGHLFAPALPTPEYQWA